ncbi:zinc finger protein 354B, partial [Silurus asotus]
MSNRLAFQTQLASIMEVLANAAVAEICKLVDDDYAVINLQMSQCQRENKALKRKLHLMELRMARGYAERRIRESSGNRSSRVQVSANLSDKYRAPVADELYGRQLNEDVWRDGEPSNADVSIGHPVIKHDENGHEDSSQTRSNALLVKAETSDDGHTQQQLFIREDGVAEPVCEGVDADYGGAQVDKVDGQNSRTRHEALEVNDEEPDVLFIKEEHSELEDQESQSHGGMTLQDGFVESSTDICGNGASSSPAQITLALHVQAVSVDNTVIKSQYSCRSCSTILLMYLSCNPDAVDSQTVGTLCSHDPVLPQRDVKVWDIPSSQSLLQGSDDSSNIPHSNQNVQRKTVVSVDVLGTNSTLYERTKDLESSFPRWAANSPSDTQPSCSYIVEVEQDQDCVLVQPGPVSVSGRQKGAASNRLQDGRGLHSVEADWSTVTASSQAHNQQFSHFNRTRLDATNQANLTQAIPNLPHPGVSLAGLQLSRRMEKGKRKSYICRYCGKAFTGQSNLEAHQRIHTGEKPFKCETCGKLFTEAGNLKKHQRVHTGEKPFVCNRCGKRFAWICNLRTHQQSASCGAV